MAESITDILSGTGADAPEPERIVDEPENLIGTDLVANQPHPDEVKPAEKPAEKQPEAKQEEPKTVPLAALQEERGKAKRYTEEVIDLRREIAGIKGLLEQRQQQPQEKPDWYTDPDAVFSERLGGALNPVQAKLAKAEGDLLRLGAIVTHGKEKVSAFEAYIQEAMERNDPEMAILSAQMRASPDPVGTGLKWFEQRTFDPAAKEAEIEAKILAKYGIKPNAEQQPEQRQTQPAPVMPSNFADVRNAGSRNGSGWSGPPPIGDVLAAGRKSIFK